jgi:hypothetical protein
VRTAESNSEVPMNFRSSSDDFPMVAGGRDVAIINNSQ